MKKIICLLWIGGLLSCCARQDKEPIPSADELIEKKEKENIQAEVTAQMILMDNFITENFSIQDSAPGFYYERFEPLFDSHLIVGGSRGRTYVGRARLVGRKIKKIIHEIWPWLATGSAQKLQGTKEFQEKLLLRCSFCLFYEQHLDCSRVRAILMHLIQDIEKFERGW